MNCYKYSHEAATWEQAEHDAMQRVIASGMFTMGRVVKASC